MTEEIENASALIIDPALDPQLDHLSRRALLGRVSAGAVAAAVITPALAQTPKKALEDPDLVKSEITFTSNGADGKPTEIKGLLVMPKHPRKAGAVIVVHEIFGLSEHIKDVACRFAQAGFIAFAPDLFTREGEVPPLSGGFGPLMQFVGKIPDKQIMEDLKAATKMLRSKKESNKKVGIVGFCWGGRVSMLLDGNAPDLNAAVAYYGRIVGQPSDMQPQHPLDLAEKMKAPLMGHFGGLDRGIPVADVEKLKDRLKEHGKTAEFYVYDKAGHAFNNDTRESFQPESAKLAWERTTDWFKKHLK